MDDTLDLVTSHVMKCHALFASLLNMCREKIELGK